MPLQLRYPFRSPYDQSFIHCDTVQGIGKDHAKWSPVSTASMKFEPDVRINKADMDLLNDKQKTALYVPVRYSHETIC